MFEYGRIGFYSFINIVLKLPGASRMARTGNKAHDAKIDGCLDTDVDIKTYVILFKLRSPKHNTLSDRMKTFIFLVHMT